MKNDHDHPELRRPEPTLLVSTETWSGRAARWLIHAAATVYVACGAAITLQLGRIAEATARWLVWPLVTILTLSAMVFIVSPLIDRTLTRGVWRLDRSGVTFRPLHGAVRTVAWRDVNDVQATPTSIRLTTPERTMRVRSGLLSDSAWADVCQRVSDHLSDRFVMSGLQGQGSPRLRGAAILVSFATTTLLATAFVVRTGAIWPLFLVIGAVAVHLGARLAAHSGPVQRCIHADDPDAEADAAEPRWGDDDPFFDGPETDESSGGLAA